MVHHIVLCKLKAGVGDEQVERIMRGARSQLLKIPEVRAIQCGKRILAANDWRFFFAADYESMDKMAEGHSDPIYERFIEDVLAPHTSEQLALSYEMDPDKDVRYS